MNATHIAFAGGTGVLTFMDIVGAIARHNLDNSRAGRTSINGESSVRNFGEETIGKDFKFVFYVSFPARSDSVGLELCEALHEYCEKNKLGNFELVVRLSREGINSGRWDQDFIEKTVSQYKDKNLKKVWVCGPPPMSETFEKYLFNLEFDNANDGSIQYEIL